MKGLKKPWLPSWIFEWDIAAHPDSYDKIAELRKTKSYLCPDIPKPQPRLYMKNAVHFNGY